MISTATSVLQVSGGMPGLTAAIGISAGVVGISAAIYLQLLSPSRCSPVYVVMFYSLGAGMVLLNYTAIALPMPNNVDVLPIVGNALILGGELYLFRWIYKNTQSPGIAEIGEYQSTE